MCWRQKDWSSISQMQLSILAIVHIAKFGDYNIYILIHECPLTGFKQWLVFEIIKFGGLELQISPFCRTNLTIKKPWDSPFFEAI